jgi:hypothetical protein
MESDSSISEWELVVDIANFAPVPITVPNAHHLMCWLVVNVSAIALLQSVFLPSQDALLCVWMGSITTQLLLTV